jgi:hypothetical protein
MCLSELLLKSLTYINQKLILSFQSYRSSADIIENYMCKPVKKGRGRPKGVLNSTIVKIQSLPRSPIKLRGKNSAGSSFMSQNLDVISKGDLSEVLEGQFIFSDLNILFLIQAK